MGYAIQARDESDVIHQAFNNYNFWIPIAFTDKPHSLLCEKS